MTTLDLFEEPAPFSDTPDADPSKIEVRKPFVRVEKPTVGLFDDSSKKAKRADLNPVQKRWFERNGWAFYRAEKANAWGSVTQDMWGCADYIACHPQRGFLLVQTTSLSNIATRFRKAEQAPELLVWLAAGGAYEVHGWFKDGARWAVRRVSLLHEAGKFVRQEVE